MTAFRLRLLMALELIVLTAIAGSGLRAGLFGLGDAVAGIFAAFIFWRSGIVALSYTFAWRHAWKAPPELEVGVLRIAWSAACEWLAFMALFVFIQPFERWWMGGEPSAAARAGRPLVLLVHGYVCNRGLWWWLRRGLRADGIPVATVNLEPPFAGIDRLAEQLHDRIESLAAETGADLVILVGHSMGGLVARAYLRWHGAARVARLVTLGTPHKGTWLAHIGLGANAREMEPENDWMRRLAAAERAPVPMLCVWSAHDNFIMPQDGARLAGAREIVLPALGHLTMLFSPAILRILRRELAAPD